MSRVEIPFIGCERGGLCVAENIAVGGARSTATPSLYHPPRLIRHIFPYSKLPVIAPLSAIQIAVCDVCGYCFLLFQVKKLVCACVNLLSHARVAIGPPKRSPVAFCADPGERCGRDQYYDSTGDSHAARVYCAGEFVCFCVCVCVCVCVRDKIGLRLLVKCLMDQVCGAIVLVVERPRFGVKNLNHFWIQTCRLRWPAALLAP